MLKLFTGITTVFQLLIVVSVLGIYLGAVEPSALDEVVAKVKYMWYAVLPT